MKQEVTITIEWIAGERTCFGCPFENFPGNMTPCRECGCADQVSPMYPILCKK